MYDLLIIGAGHAGMAAAIFAAQKNLSTLVLEKSVVIEQSLGKFELKLKSEVMSLDKNITSFVVEDQTGAVYYARAVIIASGKISQPLGITGEQKFFNKGVSDCINFDLSLFADQDVVVVGSGEQAMSVVLSLAKLARRVYVVNSQEDFIVNENLKQKLHTLLNVQFLNNTKALEISGQDTVSGIKVQTLGQAEQVLPVSQICLELSSTPNVQFDLLTEKNEANQIKVDLNMQTSVPGIFAAGDVNNAFSGPPELAQGEGIKAVEAALQYLNRAK